MDQRAGASHLPETPAHLLADVNNHNTPIKMMKVKYSHPKGNNY